MRWTRKDVADLVVLGFWRWAWHKLSAAWWAARVMLRLWWRLRTKGRAQARELAQQLHVSNAWYCGCVECKDRTYRSSVGLTVHVRRLLGVRIETVRMTDTEKRKL